MVDTSGLYTAKDFSDIVLQDNTNSINGNFLALDFEKCTHQSVLSSN